MKLTKSFKHRALGVTGGAVVVALAAGGVAYATSPSAPATPSSSGSASAAALSASSPAINGSGLRRPLRRLLRRGVHADIIVRTPSGYKTIQIDRGTLDSASSTSISLTRPDGPIVSAAVTSTTRFVGIAESQLTKGDRVIVVQTGGDAVVVRARPPRTSTTSQS